MHIITKFHGSTPAHFLHVKESRQRLRLDRFYGRNVSRERIIRFYKRVWKTMGWDVTIWARAATTEIRTREYYRRLQHFKVPRLVAYLNEKDTLLRDMVITGHASGTRHARYTHPNLQTLRAAVLKAIKPLGIDLKG